MQSQHCRVAPTLTMDRASGLLMRETFQFRKALLFTCSGLTRTVRSLRYTLRKLPTSSAGTRLLRRDLVRMHSIYVSRGRMFMVKSTLTQLAQTSITSSGSTLSLMSAMERQSRLSVKLAVSSLAHSGTQWVLTSKVHGIPLAPICSVQLF